MALSCGVDLVIELPFAYAAASAERFAAGGVQLLQATGLTCQLVFGSESGDLAKLMQLAGILSKETPEFRQHLHHFLDSGESFPAARQMAVAELTGQKDLAALLEKSNNILAVEYLKAICSLTDCRLQPMTFKRQGQAYLEQKLDGQAGFASASAIRQSIFDHWAIDPSALGRQGDLAGLFQALSAQMPAPALAVLLEQLQAGKGPVSLEDLAVPILGLLRSQPPTQLDFISGMSEGLGRRLAAAAARPAIGENTGRIAALLENTATRRFPKTRIQRALIALLMNLKPEDLAVFDAAGGPQYLRILGFNRKGRYLLKIMQKLATRPILMKASDILEYKDPAFSQMAEMDLLATDLWMLAAGRPCGVDFDTPVVMG